MRESREVLKEVRNFLAGRAVGATQDRLLLEQVIRALFCKILFIRNSVAVSNDPETLAKEYSKAFEAIRDLLPETFGARDRLQLEPDSIAFIDESLNQIDLESEDHDPFGDAYEAFLGSSIRGEEGQFFTPQNAVDLLVHMVSPQPDEKVIDPACGAGGFLSRVARGFLSAGAPPKTIHRDLFGIDKDAELVRLCAARLSLTTLRYPHVICGDSLSFESKDPTFPSVKRLMGKFDVVLTNPPFGAKIVATSKEVQAEFELGHRWRKVGDKSVPTKALANRVPPQVLFVERCLQLARAGGRVGMVVPESLLSGKMYEHVMQFMLNEAHLEAVVGMPETLFKTSGKGGTHTKTCLILLKKKGTRDRTRRTIFMADARWCGRDSRSRYIDRDDLPLVRQRFDQWRSGRLRNAEHTGFALATKSLVRTIALPRYYDPGIQERLVLLEKTHSLKYIGSLEEEGLLEIRSGDEVGKLAYGEGSVPFIRTSDISNWEIKIDPKHCVSEETYERLREKQDVRQGDILMVRDGTYLIGTCAYVTKYDTRIVYQSHIYKLRSLDHNELSPFLLLALLSSPVVQSQITAKRFTQDIIDSLGGRIREIVLPIPKQGQLSSNTIELVTRAIDERVEARELARRARYEVVGDAPPSTPRLADI